MTTLDVVRASTFVSSVSDVPTKAPECKLVELKQVFRPNRSLDFSPSDTIPVVGGHSGITIVPLLSQSEPALPKEVLNDESKLAALVKRIQFGGDGSSVGSKTSDLVG